MKKEKGNKLLLAEFFILIAFAIISGFIAVGYTTFVIINGTSVINSIFLAGMLCFLAGMICFLVGAIFDILLNTPKKYFKLNQEVKTNGRTTNAKRRS